MNETAQQFDYTDLSIEANEGEPLNPLQQQLAGFVTATDSDFNFAATLTFRQPITSRATAKTYGVQFQQFYNDALGKPNWQSRHDKFAHARAAMVAVLESDGLAKQLHYHMLLSKSDDIPDFDFQQLVCKAWSQTGNGCVRSSEIKPIHNDFGWACYLLKEVTSTSLAAVHAELTFVIHSRV